MRELRRNIRLVLIVLMAAFAATAGFAVYSVYTYGGRWLNSPYNPRLHITAKQVTPGDILDREGTVLATTKDGQRAYPGGSTLRKAASHVLGDTRAVVATGAETFLAAHLLGFDASLPERVADLLQGGQRRGDDVALSVSAKLQRYAHDQFPSGKDGAAVVMNYKTGELLLMYASPEFDPMRVEDALKEEAGSALVNRVTQGRYTPGSVFKIITAAAVMEHMPSLLTGEFVCTGELAGGERPVKCSQAHGALSFQRAFEVSCNCAFAHYAALMGEGALRMTAEQFGFGRDAYFADLIAYDSRFPQERLTGDDLGWTAVGQGTTLVTPLHMALISCAIARGGQMPEPKLVLSVTAPSGRVAQKLSPSAYLRVSSAAVAGELQKLMRGVVSDGTGARAAVKGYSVCGKTGTAQVSDSGAQKSHAWFTGFVADERAPLAVCVVVEHGGGGGEVAAPLAGKLLSRAIDLYFSGR